MEPFSAVPDTVPEPRQGPWSEMGESPSPSRKIIFTAQNAAGDQFALVAYNDGTVGVLKNDIPHGEPCPADDGERCVRLLLSLIES